MTRKINELASNASIEVFNGALAGKVFQLEEEVVIGRQDENTVFSATPYISLPDNSVSRRHARIFTKNGQYFLEDLNSTNGTFLNTYNVAMQEPVMMRRGGNVQVGETHLKFLPASETEELSDSENSSLPWQSEIGLNEQAIDLSTPISSEDDAENRV